MINRITNLYLDIKKIEDVNIYILIQLMKFTLTIYRLNKF